MCQVAAAPQPALPGCCAPHSLHNSRTLPTDTCCAAGSLANAECCMLTLVSRGLLPVGVWSALQEIEWTQQAARHCPALHFYVMGFYIHSCPKMTYKARFKPSELLCDQRHCWVPLEAVRGALDVSSAACQHRMHDHCRSQELLCAACLES